MTVQPFVVRRTWLEGNGTRLDAGAFAGGAFQVREQLMRCGLPSKPMATLAEIFNGPRFSRIYVRDSRRGTPFLSSSGIMLADMQDLPLLAKSIVDRLPKLHIEEGWTLVSCSGTIGNTSYVRGEIAGWTASQHVMRVVPTSDNVAPGYLFAFLSTSVGRELLQENTYGSIIQHIEPHHIADLPVPLPDPADQQRIHDLVAGAAAARTEANRLLDEAAAYFDGLVDPMRYAHDHARAAGVVRRSRLSMRLDAFHHVGWAVQSIAHEGTTLEQLAHVSRPGIVKRRFVQRGTPFVSGIDVYQHRPTFRQHIMTSEAKRANTFVHTGQILIQRGGQRYGLLGRPAMVTQRMDGWSASEDLIRVALHDKHHIPWVFAFLRSESGRRLTLRHSYGTSIPKLNEAGIATLHIPSLPHELAANATRALALREQADADEERAIQEVEAWLG